MALRAEAAALVRILESRELTGEFSGDWRALLRTARTTEPYLATVHRYDDVFERMGDASSRGDVDRLFESVELHEPFA
jgi:hypothetical protein